MGASVDWLKEVGRLEDANIKVSKIKDYLAGLENLSNEELAKENELLSTTVKKVWNEIETSFLPKRAKYT